MVSALYISSPKSCVCKSAILIAFVTGHVAHVGKMSSAQYRKISCDSLLGGNSSTWDTQGLNWRWNGES